MKHKIDNAIKVASRVLSEDFGLYMSCLSNEEELEEAVKLKDAFITLNRYGVPMEDVLLHYKRQLDKPFEPIPFIDRPHFTAVETDELPF